MSIILPKYEWKLVYEDGRQFTSFDGKPWESPVMGASLLAQPRQEDDLLASRDHLIYRTDVGYWTEHDLIGLLDQFSHYARFITCHRITRQWPSLDAFRKLHHSVAMELRGK